MLDNRALAVANAATRAQLGEVIARIGRCQDVRMESHELGSEEAQTAWDILLPHVQAPQKPGEPAKSAPVAAISIGIADVNPALRSHACMIACLLRDVVLRCQRVLRHLKQKGVCPGLLKWARRINHVRCDLIRASYCRAKRRPLRVVRKETVASKQGRNV